MSAGGQRAEDGGRKASDAAERFTTLACKDGEIELSIKDVDGDDVVRVALCCANGDWAGIYVGMREAASILDWLSGTLTLDAYRARQVCDDGGHA